MSWRDRLRPASFRGLAFFVEEAEGGFGRNVVEHEYPGQAPPFFEDLGRRARTWTIEAIVLGDDYQTQRDRLTEAAELKGAGEFVHPYYGALQVVCRQLSVRESVREGRMARLLFAFVEASEAVTPSTFEDPSDAVSDALDGLFGASSAAFLGAWDPDDEPANLIKAGAEQAGGFFDYLRQLQLSGPVATVGAWRDKLEAMAGSSFNDLQQPSLFAEKVRGLLVDLVDAVGSRRSAIEAFLGLGHVPPSRSFGTSTASVRADGNRDAVGRLFREEGAALAASSSTQVAWTNYDDALAARTRALEAITAAQELAGDEAFRELANVARAMTEALPLAPGTLPGLEAYPVLQSTNALVLAYRLYDDVARAQEIADRNRIANPLTIPGGLVLEVLARA